MAYHVSVNINGAELSFCGQWCCAIALAGQRQASAVRRTRCLAAWLRAKAGGFKRQNVCAQVVLPPEKLGHLAGQVSFFSAFFEAFTVIVQFFAPADGQLYLDLAPLEI